MKADIGKEFIGVAGCGSGCGSTHLSMALANYTASRLGLRTAYVELGENSQMSVLKTEQKAKEQEGYFTYQDIDMFCSVRKEKLPVLFQQEYDIFILDIGGNLKNCREEYLRCDRKLLLGNYVKWKSGNAERTLEGLGTAEWGFLEPELYTVFSEEKERRRLEKKYHIRVRQVPVFSDAFHIRREQFEFLDRLV